MWLVGITGAIGAGKSTVLAELAGLGAATLDADTVVHALYAVGGRVHREVVARWGERVLGPDGAVDRRAVGERVFAAAGERVWLNGLIHPLVKRRVMAAARRASTPLFCAVPLLFEVGWERSAWRTVAVWCDAGTQDRRLRARGWSEETIRQRLAAQLGSDEKLLRADYALVNNGGRFLLRRQCARLLQWVAAERDRRG